MGLHQPVGLIASRPRFNEREQNRLAVSRKVSSPSRDPLRLL